ncbi:MAG: Druantia anti-phage system protein DruA [Pseudomonadota bacterium]
MRYCGRNFTEEELSWIREIIANQPELNRKGLSILFCRTYNWLKPDGGTKDMSCRVAMLKMEKDGFLSLPPPKKKHTKPYKRLRTLWAVEQSEITSKAGDFDLVLEIVTHQTGALWNEFIDRYHYLGYKTLPGAQLRYFVKAEGRILALLGYGAAAWKTAPRDNHIGWDRVTRRKNLHLVVNNARFLILPWVHSKNLGSKILSLASKRISDDWQARYNYCPVLLETFVEKERFRGTCYKAANWLEVGETCGKGKLGNREGEVPTKTVWLYPLCKDFRTRLSQ